MRSAKSRTVHGDTTSKKLSATAFEPCETRRRASSAAARARDRPAGPACERGALARPIVAESARGRGRGSDAREGHTVWVWQHAAAAPSGGTVLRRRLGVVLGAASPHGRVAGDGVVVYGGSAAAVARDRARADRPLRGGAGADLCCAAWRLRRRVHRT